VNNPMTLPELSSIVASAAEQKNMRSRNDLGEPGWIFWERRTLNLHRVVGLLGTDRQFTDAHKLDAELRGVLAHDFKRAWWRGIAYGVIANVGALLLTPDDLRILVDAYENEKGTMQWVILVAGDSSEATGVHTWIEGYLSPVYRAVLQALKERGCQVASVRKEKDGLLRFLKGVADARAMARTGRVAFPEFRDPFLNEKEAASKSKNHTAS
jgi:hypothetical protein